MDDPDITQGHALKLIRQCEPTQRRIPWITIAYQQLCPIRKARLAATSTRTAEQLQIQPQLQVAAARGGR